MKAYISVDLEGVNGISHSSQTQPTESGYQRGIDLMHRETNAVIEGLLEGGVDQIVVNDSHWDMRNLNIEKLAGGEKVSIRSGWQKPFSMVSGLTESENKPDFAVFLGYHAMAGHPTGVLSHTYRAQIFLQVKINGTEVGETGLNAALAGTCGVPVALVTGDDIVLAEARTLLGKVHTAQVKTAVSRYSAVFPAYEATLANLKQRAKEAARDKSYWQLYKVSEPVELAITMYCPTMADAAELLPDVRRVDGRTVVIEAKSYQQAFKLMLAAGALGASRKDPHFS